MSFFTDWLRAWQFHNHELSRIAAALERIAPPLDDPTVGALRPEDAVTYVDERVMAMQEEAESMGELERYMQEHGEEMDTAPERTT